MSKLVSLICLCFVVSLSVLQAQSHCDTLVPTNLTFDENPAKARALLIWTSFPDALRCGIFVQFPDTIVRVRVVAVNQGPDPTNIDTFRLGKSFLDDNPGTYGAFIKCDCGASFGPPVDTSSVSDTLSFVWPVLRMGTDQELHSSVQIFPNPASDFVYIKTPGEMGKNTSIEVYDMLGRIHHRMEIKTEGTMVQLDLRDLENGIYFIKAGENSEPQKLLIRR